MAEKENDPINPSHYKAEHMEVIDVIEDFDLNYYRANAVKYLLRAGKKDPNKVKEDLQKAEWYLQREIDRL